MSRENVELGHRVIDAFNRRDLDVAIAMFAPDAEWQMAREDPDYTTQRGRRAIRRMWEGWIESYPDLRLIAEEIIPATDRVFIWVRMSGHGAASGAAVEMHEAYVSTVRDGSIVRLEEYFDRRQGLGVAGLSEGNVAGRH